MAASFGLGKSAQTAQDSTYGSSSVDASTPWVAAADGNLSLLQSSLQTLHLPLTCADENGYTLLQAAASYSHLPILTWLVEHVPAAEKAAWINAVDKEGDSALHYASTCAAAEVLLQQGVDPSLRNAENKTALESKQEELVEHMEDQDNDDGDDEPDEDILQLRQLIEFLSSTKSTR